MNNERSSQVLVDGEWTNIRYEDIKKGNQFRLFEPDGTRVCDGDANVWLATSDAYYDQFDSWAVQTISVKEENI